MGKISEVNALNIRTISPEDMLSYFHNRYDGVKIPEEIEFINLVIVEQMLGFLANEKAYLNYMSSLADIMARQYKNSDSKSDYNIAVCKKTIIANYIDTLETLTKALSRMITVYQMEQEDIKQENKISKLAAV